MIFKHKRLIFTLLLFLCIFLTMSFINAEDDNIATNDTYTSKSDYILVPPKELHYFIKNEPVDNIETSADNNSSNDSVNIVNKTIKKESIKIITKNNVFSKKSKIKKYSLFLKDNDNKALKNTKITLKIKGKTFYAKTNSNGKVTFK